METLLKAIAALAAILILLVILTLSPLVLRVLRALARKWFLLITHRWRVRAEHRHPEPCPLPDTVVPETLAGISPCEVERRFGRRSTETRIDDIVEMAWNDVDPRLVCFFKDGACVLATLDPYWHRRARSEDELRRIFSDTSTLLGKTLEDLERVAGTCHQLSNFDYGREVVSWHHGRTRIEAWFDNGVCTNIDITGPDHVFL